MKSTGWTTSRSGLATMSGLAALAGAVVVGAPIAGADDVADPAVVAAREAAAAQPQEPGYQNPLPVEPVGPAAAPTSTSARMADLYTLSAVSTSGGYIEVGARDNPAQDKPGAATTTLRIYGNAAAFRSGAGDLGLISKFTCTGSAISGVTIGVTGASVSGGATSSTLTWPSLRAGYDSLRQYYTEGGHFRCKASNLTPAKFTRRGTAATNYKNVETRAEDSYSFAW